MPLVIVCGRPCTGKSGFARALSARLSSQGLPVALLCEERPRGGSVSPVTEKAVRGALRAAAERACDGTTTVIVDGLNDVKGFRYELYCLARAAGTTHAVVALAARRGAARRWDAARGADGYGAAEFDALWSRFEAPDERHRWDAPLFCLDADALLPGGAAGEAEARLGEEEEAAVLEAAGSEALPPPPPPLKSAFVRAAPPPPPPPRSELDDDEDPGAAGSGVSALNADEEAGNIDAIAAPDASSFRQRGILSSAAAAPAVEAAPPPSPPSRAILESTLDAVFDALFRRRGLKPVPATARTATAPPDYLQALDRATAAVVEHLAVAVRGAAIGDDVSVPGCTVQLTLRRRPVAEELRALKRAFDRDAAAAPMPSGDVARSFLAYLNAHLQ